MKRNKTTNRAPRSGRSPWVTKDKTAYAYPAWVTDRSKPIPKHILEDSDEPTTRA